MNEETTKAQEAAITAAEKKGFRETSRFVVAGELTVVLARRRGPTTVYGEVEADGKISGLEPAEFLKQNCTQWS